MRRGTSANTMVDGPETLRHLPTWETGLRVAKVWSDTPEAACRARGSLPPSRRTDRRLALVSLRRAAVRDVQIAGSIPASGFYITEPFAGWNRKVLATMEPRRSNVSSKTSAKVLDWSAGALAFELLVLIALCFQPSWAAGWPGISKHTVFGAVVTGLFWMVLVTAITAVVALVLVCLDRKFGVRPNIVHAVSFFVVMVFLILLTIIAFSATVFRSLRDSIAREWP